jgi:hypothetical protein
MLLACADKAAAVALCRHPVVAERLAPELRMPRAEARDTEWAIDARVRDTGVAAQATGCAAIGAAQAGPRGDDLDMATVNLHRYYLELQPQLVVSAGPYRDLWDAYLATLRVRLLGGEVVAGTTAPSGALGRSRVVDFATPGARVRAMRQFHFSHAMQPLVGAATPLVVRRALRVGTLQLRAGGWFLARRRGLPANERAVWWFGCVERVVTHVGPDRHPTPRVLVQVRIGGRMLMMRVLMTAPAYPKLGYSGTVP